MLERQGSSARLTRLTQELAQMQEVYTSQYPDVVRLKAEIAGLKRLPRASSAVGEEFRVLDPAIPARIPVAPQRVGFILLGIGLGLAAAVAAVLLADQFAGRLDRDAALADCRPDRGRPGTRRVRLLPPREEQRPAGFSLLAKHAVRGR